MYSRVQYAQLPLSLFWHSPPSYAVVFVWRLYLTFFAEASSLPSTPAANATKASVGPGLASIHAKPSALVAKVLTRWGRT